MDSIDDISNVTGLFKNDWDTFNNATSPPQNIKALDKEDAKRL